MKYSSFTIIKRIFNQARPLWPQLTGIFLLNLIAAPISLLQPLPLKILIDSGFGKEQLPAYIGFAFPPSTDPVFGTIVLVVAIFVILIAFINNIHAYIVWLVSTNVGEKLVLDFRSKLFNQIQRLSIAYHDREGTSDALYRIQYDTVAIRSFLIGNFASFVSSVITLLAMVGVMLLINWKLALIALCIIPILMFLTRLSTVRLNREWSKVKVNESKAMSVVHEVLGSLRVVKAFGQEEMELERFAARAGDAVKSQVKVARVAAGFYFLAGMVFAAGTALFLYFGAIAVQSGSMTLGDLTLVMAYLAQIFGPLDRISKNLNDIQSSLVSVDRVFTILDKEREVPEAANPLPLARCNGSVQFDQVSFSYGEDRKILQNISFEVNTGDRVGIIGTTGAGKSTLINLLMRFYDVESGTVYVDGKDIRQYKLADYRNQFGLVLQEPVLFSTSIAENIAYGKPGATRKEIIAAAKMANAHEFIENCSNGYDTLVGERGMQLSGGERQRLSIARAFIKDAPILILDEPTSALDVKTESQIMEAMERLMQGRTSFMITHRIDTVKSCNIILHLEKGRLVDAFRNEGGDLLEKKKKQLLEIKI
ncbi:ABC transporter ATP-binding protein [Flavihumibacter stibioxidans]|uniref:ABC transporter ATP-binding protein n=1 Tax=Flavihumibacter stibioxidans TaxID=1834163 RepID=A0ABR7M9M3_9BACT|nr:ABC transporter ATP-binding protein [Flavihumibacter stibioxidans]MBC6491728.1 hypothetical protein [Flavihumibacter stibioxidans]